MTNPGELLQLLDKDKIFSIQIFPPCHPFLFWSQTNAFPWWLSG